jgi:predicted Zn-dependent peptidase
MGMAFLKGRTLADEIEALATLTVDDVNKALQTMLLEENSAYIQIDPKE